MNIAELKEKKISELTQMAKKFNIDGAAGMALKGDIPSSKF